jgi:hypothetical protein
MSGADFLFASALLGALIFFAGAYGVLYALGQLRGQRALLLAAFVAYGLQCASAAALFLTPLGGWTLVIALSCALYLPLPPLTWRYMARLHAHGG